MNEYGVLAIFIAVLVVAFFVKGAYDEKKKEQRFIKNLYKNYGQIPKKEYNSEQYASIAKYFEAHADGFFIDNITWNDLDMDAIFMQMNHTYSSAGEEYLYHTLRTPKFSKEALDKQEQRVRFFMDNADMRVKMQVLFAKVGKTGKYSLYSYLDFLDNVKDISNWKHIIPDVLLLAMIGVSFFHSFGIAMTIAIVCGNIMSYFQYKDKIEPYIVSFQYIMRMLFMADEIKKVNVPILQEEQEQLKELTAKFRKFRRGSSWILSGNRMNGGGDPLSLIADYIRMIFHVDVIQFNKMMKEIRGKKAEIDGIVTVAGSIETAIAIGAYRASFPAWCVPEFVGNLKMEAGYHPLLEEPVKNSIFAKKGVLLTGSNASGKSTFLKTVAINAILSQTIYTALADKFETDFYRIYSSIALRDNLDNGESYYIVEIKSLKRIIDAGEEENKVLCFVDEVLRGTNTVERIAASTQILKSFADKQVVCFAATHDIELTSLLAKEYDNYHFEEEVKDGDILFNYELKEGKAKTRNAIKLLGIMGYREDIIKKANQMAENFIDNGLWDAELT